MPQIINTNIASLTAQRNLNGSQSSLNVSLQRLSSGLRINSAKDDAAGLAISERFTTQIRGLNQAVRNANDGISFAQTAEGALSTVGDAMQRIRELAVQSANDTNSSSDRQALNNEVQQLIAEINRVATSTQFNGQNILDGSLSTLTFQVGANQNQTIQVDGVDSRGSRLGADTLGGTYVLASEIAAASAFTVNGQTVDLTGVSDVNDAITAVNLVAADSGVTAQKATELAVDFTYADVDATLSLNGVDISVLAASDDADTLAAKINAVSGQTGVSAENNAGTLTLTSANAADMTITQSALVLTGADAPAAATPETYQAGILLATDVGADGTAAAASFVIGGADAADFGFDGTEVATRNILNDVDVLTSANATDALLSLDFALQQASGLRAELGAVQIRFESTISNLSVSVENLSAARSRIQDADFAAETANLTRAQILQQAGVSVLAQANALPQNVLALLQ